MSNITPKRNSFGSTLKAARNKAGWTMARLAEKAHVSTTFISEMERGTRLPSANTVCCLSRALPADIRELSRAVVASWGATFLADVEEQW